MNYSKKYIDRLDETIYYGVHKTGLRVYVVPKKGFSKTYAIYGTKFGSVNNHFVPLGKEEDIVIPDGVAHFLEHKMFEQPDGSNAFDIFSKYGANANAFTSFTNTSYLFSCTEHFDECFRHLLNYVQQPYYTDENIEKEQGIIGQEIRMYDDDGEWLVMFNMLRALYQKNPVRIDIAGTVESIAKINKDILYDCYNTYYNPANMVVCVAGDVNADDVFKAVDETVKYRDNGEVKNITCEEPDEICQKYIEASASVSRPIFNIGFKDIYLKSGDELLKREAGLKLMLRIMFGRSSDFYKVHYGSGLINDTFDTDVMTELEFSCVSCGGESDDPEKVQREVLKTVEKYKKEGFEQNEFERIKKAFFGSFVRTFNNVESIGGLLCRNYLSNVDISKFPSVYSTITSEYLSSLLNEVMNKDSCVLSVVKPI